MDPIKYNLITPFLESGELKKAQEASLTLEDIKIQKLIQSGLYLKHEEREGEEDMTTFEGIRQHIRGDLPREGLLQETDLVVFKDSFRGHLPLNGIKEGDFDKWNQRYSDLVQGKTLLKIEGEPAFKDQMNAVFAKIISRRLGRDLLEATVFKPGHSPILLAQTEEDSKANIHHFKIFINSNHKHFIISQLKNGQKVVVERPLFLVVFHELTHIYNAAKENALGKRADLLPTLSKRFTNLEEQATITGLSEPLLFKEQEGSTQDFDWKENEEFYLDYQDINENNMAASVGEPIRFTHDSFMPLSHSVDVGAPEVKECMVHCISLGLVEEIKTWLDKGFDVNQGIGPKNLSPLGLAIKAQDPQMMKFLISRGANVNQVHPNPDKGHLLHYAIKEGHKETVEVLLEHGADVNLPDADGKSPLLWAADANLEIFKLLRDRGADLSDSIQRAVFERAGKMGDMDMINYLMREGIFYPTSELMQKAVEQGSEELMRLFFRPEFDAWDEEGHTLLEQVVKAAALYEAESAYSLPHLFHFLLDLGVNPNLLDQSGQTILHFLLSSESHHLSPNQQLELIRVLIQKGADASIRNAEGKTVFELWQELNHSNLATLLAKMKDQESQP